ncbi:MAG TPA: hypothetical protein ACFE0H_11390 [Elainellaceae cyanobacterium]
MSDRVSSLIFVLRKTSAVAICLADIPEDTFQRILAALFQDIPADSPEDVFEKISEICVRVTDLSLKSDERREKNKPQ